MSWLEFVSTTVGQLVWPILILVVIFLLRREIGQLLSSDRLRRLKAGASGIEVEFERDLDRAEKQLPTTPGEAIKELPTDDAQEVARDFLTEMAELAAVSPRSVVLESHSRLERLLRRSWAADTNAGADTVPVSMRSLGRFAVSRGILNPAEVQVLNELTNLRNRVVHQDDTAITSESAQRYAALALELAVSIRRNTDDQAQRGAEL